MVDVQYADEEMREALPQRNNVRKTKGRGFQDRDAEAEDDRGGRYDTHGMDSRGPIKSVESWVVFVSGVHEEAQEEDIQEIFADCGEIKNVHLNLDRRTGYVKGYALIEYGEKTEAELAIESLNGKQMLEQSLVVDWAFAGGPAKRRGARR